MAPEVLRKNKYSEKADVYSFGILLWEIFSGKRPYDHGEFRTMNQAQLMLCILEKHARPPLDGLDSALQQLIQDCWNLDPRLRPSFSEIVVRLRRLKTNSIQSTNNSSLSSIPQEYDPNSNSRFFTDDDDDEDIEIQIPFDFRTKSSEASVNFSP